MALTFAIAVRSEPPLLVMADGFFLGTYMTLLEENEVMCEIRVPAFAKGTGSAYEKLKRKTGDWATAGCAVVIRKNGDQVSHVRISLTNVAPTALRAEAAEADCGGADGHAGDGGAGVFS